MVKWSALGAIIALLVAGVGAGFFFGELKEKLQMQEDTIQQLNQRLNSVEGNVNGILGVGVEEAAGEPEKFTVEEKISKLRDVVESDYGGNLYVVMESSSKKSDLKRRLNKMKRALDAEFEEFFSEIMICKTITGNDTLALVAGPPMKRADAEALREDVIFRGLKDDAFVSVAWRYDCSQGNRYSIASLQAGADSSQAAS